MGVIQMSWYYEGWYTIGWYLNGSILMGVILMSWYLNVWYSISWYLNVGIQMGGIQISGYFNGSRQMRLHLWRDPTNERAGLYLEGGQPGNWYWGSE